MVKKETKTQKGKLVHLDAFEIYYEMGASRSLAKMHKGLTNSALVGEFDKIVPSLRTLKEWSRKHRWMDRCLLKDLATADLTEKKSLRSMIDRKAKWLSLVENRIDTITDEKGKLQLPIVEAKDFSEMVKLGLSLIGEAPTEQVSHTIKIIEVREKARED